MAVATTPVYTPNPPTVSPQTEDGRNLADWMQRELKNISQAFTDASRVQLAKVSAPPTTPREGLITYADGISWNPNGVGKGVRVFDPTGSGIWRAMGAPFGPAGANHVMGLVPDPGAVTHTPALYLGDDGTFHTVSSGFPTPTRAGDIIYWNGSTWTTLAGNNAGTLFLQETAAGVPSWASVGATSGTLVSRQVFSTSNASLPIPATATKAVIAMWGGTGGSGGAAVANILTGGTGAAGYLEKYLTGLTPGATLNYTQGAAGAAGTGGGTDGGSGTASTLASGTQVIGTLTANGSAGSLGSTLGGTVTSGTAGGTATGGDLNLTGTAGQDPTGAVSGTSNNASPGVLMQSQGAFGISSVGALAGNSGNPGGLIIMWFT
jgi:hypothetical protein